MTSLSPHDPHGGPLAPSPGGPRTHRRTPPRRDGVPAQARGPAPGPRRTAGGRRAAHRRAPAPSHGHPHGHAHGHGHGPPTPASRRVRLLVTAVLVPFAVAVLAGLVALWPGGAPRHAGAHAGVGFDQELRQGRVLAVTEVACADVGVRARPGDGPCRRVTVEVRSGADTGTVFTETVPPDRDHRLHPGLEVVLSYSPDAPEKLRYSIADVTRGVPLTLVGAVFAVAVVVVGRWRGLLALAGLGISFAVLTLFILPAVLRGSPPLLVAVVGGSAIMLGTLYLCHGFSTRTSVAALGTLASLLLIGLLGWLFIDAARLTGNTSDHTALVHSLYPDLELRGLLLAGVLIGSLGVLDDVTVTQTSAVWELWHADPTASRRRLYRAAMRIGRDHIASVVNTLVLAYAGTALPLLLLFSIAHTSVGEVASSELVAEEIVRTLVGSVGLVASVPLTTLLATLVVSADRPRAAVGGEADAASGGRRRRTRRRR